MLRGIFVVVVVVREPEAQAVFGFGFGAAGCIVLVVVVVGIGSTRSRSSAARVNAFAMLTVVSFTLHLSGLGGEAKVRARVVVVLRSCSLRRAYRTRAGSSLCGGGERERVPSDDGALQFIISNLMKQRWMNERWLTRTRDRTHLLFVYSRKYGDRDVLLGLEVCS